MRHGWKGPRPRAGRRWRAALVGGLCPLLASPTAWAQPPAAPAPAKAAPPAAEDEQGEDPNVQSTVTVTARRRPPQPGAVVGDIKPEESLSPADIRTFGDSTVTELIDDLAPETRSDRGRGGEAPVILLNGRRISSFAEVQNIPTEAILRIDILPEEVSLKYGYTADQRVVNIVLRRRFHAITGEAQGGGPTEGGQVKGQAEADQLILRGDNRLNLDLKYTGQSDLTEADRGLTSVASGQPYDLLGNVTSAPAGGAIPGLGAATVAGVPAGLTGAASLADFAPSAGVANTTDVGPYRTLLPATQAITANAVAAKPLSWGLRGTANATLGATSSQSLQGLPGLAVTVPQGDPFSPFPGPVQVDRYTAALGPLRQSVTGFTAHLGTTLNKDFGAGLDAWRLSLTDAYDHADTWSDTDAGVDAAPPQDLLTAQSTGLNPFAALPASLVTALAQNRAHSATDSANIQVLANGPLLKIPAGDLYASVKVGDTESLQASSSVRLGLAQAVHLSRNDANAQVNLDLPLTSRDHHVLGFVGDLSINGNAAVDELSDYGLLTTIGYGVNWSPVEGFNVIVSHTSDQAAPTVQQLGAAEVLTPGVRLFDYATGQTVDVTQVAGGNALLKADHRQVTKVGVTWKPLEKETLTLTANYVVSRIANPISTFPAADAAIEAAFPDRFLRDGDGVLEEEDDRAVNFAASDREELRWGLNYSHPLGPQPPPRPSWRRRRQPGGDADQAPGGQTANSQNASGQTASGQNASSQNGAGGQNGAAGGASADRRDGGGGGRGYGGGGGRGGFGGGFGGGGRFQLALYHTVYFVDREVLRPGGPTLDFLNGAAMGETGGQYQHEIEAQAGFTLYGFGGRVSADWRSATRVVGSSGAPADDLSFSSIGVVNARLFDDFSQQRPVTSRFPWARGARLTLAVTNLFDTRIRVVDGSGRTPLIYQPAYLDPAGRTVTLAVRKLFF